MEPAVTPEAMPVALPSFFCYAETSVAEQVIICALQYPGFGKSVNKLA